MKTWNLALATSFLTLACGQASKSDSQQPAAPGGPGASLVDSADTMQDGDIVDVAQSAGQFSTLLAAVGAAGLEDALRGDGPLTVFAPTDAAFAELGDEAISDLLANPEKLKSILLYHVVGAKVLAADALNLESADTLNGAPLSISNTAEGLRINSSLVTAFDVMASNGVIHVIDKVLLPPADVQADIIGTATEAGSFTTLVAAIEAAGLTEALSGSGPFTVFAPTDAAFAELGQDTIDQLLANPEQLKQILLYHVVAGAVPAADASNLSTAATLNGQELNIMTDSHGALNINSATVTAADIFASNGIIHVIDKVLIPGK